VEEGEKGYATWREDLTTAREEKKQLREEKKQLREEKNLLLKAKTEAPQGVRASVLCVVALCPFLSLLCVLFRSQLKKVTSHLVGRFDPSFVDELLTRYFNLSITTAVVELCANRRAIEHLLVELKARLSCVLDDDHDRADKIMSAAASSAFDKWSGPVRAQLPTSSIVAVSAFAHVLFPESAGGHIAWVQFGNLWLQVASFPKGNLPEPIKVRSRRRSQPLAYRQRRHTGATDRVCAQAVR